MRFYENLSTMCLFFCVVLSLFEMYYIEVIFDLNLHWHFISISLFLYILGVIFAFVGKAKKDDWMFDETKIYHDETDDL